MKHYTLCDWKSIAVDCKKSFVKSRKKRDGNAEFLNIPLAFDTETSSFTVVEENEKGEPISLKRGCMYLWQFGIKDTVYYGRTYKDLKIFLESMKKALRLSPKRKVIVYVHNLAFDFQFIRKWFKVTEIFAREERKVMYAELDGCIVMKCSYILTNKNLELLSKETETKKLVGDLDYGLLRTPETYLTKDELRYAENDIKILLEYIGKQIQKEGDVTKIPLTSTGYVRRYYLSVLQNSYIQEYKKKYDPVIKLDYTTFKALEKAFTGGYTHACFLNSGTIQEKVKSIDFTSSYPFCIVAEKYPVKKFQHIKVRSQEHFERLVENKPCIIDIIFEKIENLTNISIISESKCTRKENVKKDNGRILKADYIETTITDIDYKILKKYYKCNDYVIVDMFVSDYGYLPKEMIEATLKLYQDKTKLKDVEGQEDLYQLAKALLNSLYGMCVTNPLTYDIKYDEYKGWYTDDKITEEEAIEKLKKSTDKYSTVLSFAWGVWITAHARKNLLTFVKIIGDDVIYCDTDSIKYKNYYKYEDSLNAYNEELFQRAVETVKYYNLDVDMLSPCDIKGINHPLGVFTDEGVYDYFKTLGAKRYITCTDMKIKLTVAGLSKKHFYKFLNLKYGGEHTEKYYRCQNEKEIFEIFNFFDFFFMENGMKISEEYTGKLTHCYGDTAFVCEVTDYQGKKCIVSEKSWINLQKQPFEMSSTQDFVDLLYKEVNINKYFIDVKKKKLERDRERRQKK